MCSIIRFEKPNCEVFAIAKSAQTTVCFLQLLQLFSPIRRIAPSHPFQSCTNGTAADIRESFAALVTIQRPPPNQPPCINVNSAARAEPSACNFGGYKKPCAEREIENQRFVQTLFSRGFNNLRSACTEFGRFSCATRGVGLYSAINSPQKQKDELDARPFAEARLWVSRDCRTRA